jgi:SAM-dependent methyltransferase
VYGFSRFEEHIQDYFRTYHILRLLEEIRFSSFLDVGCAEGYLVNLVRRLFGAEGYGVDIAPSGVRRARDLYAIPGAAADAHHLPFADKSFDVVLSSETLEHVADPGAVIRELIRVARHYVILSTPAARDEAEFDEHMKHVDPNLIFSHFHFFTEQQMRSWLPPETVFYGAGHRRMAPVFDWFSAGFDQTVAIRDLVKFLKDSCPAMAPETLERYENHTSEIVSRRPPWWRHLLGPGALALALRADYRLSRRSPQQTFAFLTLTPCHGTPFVPDVRRVPGLLRILLRENRVDPLKLASVADVAHRPVSD